MFFQFLIFRSTFFEIFTVFQMKEEIFFLLSLKIRIFTHYVFLQFIFHEFNYIIL